MKIPEKMVSGNEKRKSFFWLPAMSKDKPIKVKSRIKTMASFQDSIKVTLVIGQCFSLMPVYGIYNKKSSDVRFCWKSFKTLYTAIAFIGQLCMTGLGINYAAHEPSLKSMSNIVFYITACITMVTFLQAAIKWPKLSEIIAQIEEIDPSYDTKLKRKCNITCGVVLGLALVEHILSQLSGFATALTCFPHLSTYEGFMKFLYSDIFDYIPYFTALAVLLQILHIQSTFIWNFSDVFVICMSYFLTSRLEKVNKKLLEAQGKYLPESFWRSVREEYCRTTQIVRSVDEVIGGVVFISFANNLFFICLQLFNTLENGLKGSGQCNSRYNTDTLLRGNEAVIYYLFSLVYLLSRSVAVSLIAAHVNTASEVPAVVLFDVPTPVYCTEVQRFLDQTNTHVVALSGMQFFNVTKSLLLTVAGTIVTYELVMFQFISTQQ